METLTPPPPTTVSTTLTAAIATVKTPDPDSEPPQSTAVANQLPPPLTNGVLKRHKPFHHHQPPPAPAAVVTYKECMKNHAAPMGGHATDGCGEFMPSPTSSPSYPTSLKCAACGCHRNFHRREPDDTLFLSTTTQHVIEYQPHHRHHPPPPPPPAAASPGNSPSPPPISSSYYPSAPHMLLALSSGVSPPPSDNLPTNPNIPAIPTTPGSGPPGTGFGLAGSNPSGKKRFRTKFTQDQKEKMHEIAERVGWKMQKRDEDMIIGFCNQIGVDKNVFKVWMHNNKTTFGIKKIDNNVSSINNGNSHNSSAEGIDFIISRNQDLHGHHHDHQQHLVVNNVMCTKGSSSSS